MEADPAVTRGSGDADETEERLEADGFVYKRLGPELLSADAWDDSALVRAWESATAQYKEAHSDSAKRQRDVKPLASSAERPGHKSKRPRGEDWRVGDACQARWSEDGKWYSAEVTAVAGDSVTVNFVDYEQAEQVTLANVRRRPSRAAGSSSAAAAPAPAPTRQPAQGSRAVGAPIGAVAAAVEEPPRLDKEVASDEDLANLLMAWYYSGYYTGFYQGKRQRH